jgi:hypothetical protein
MVVPAVVTKAILDTSKGFLIGCHRMDGVVSIGVNETTSLSDKAGQLLAKRASPWWNIRFSINQVLPFSRTTMKQGD